MYSRTTFIRIANYPDRPDPSGKFVENSTKQNFLEITGYRFKYSTVLWLLEFHIWRGRKDYTQVHTVNSNSRTANCQCSLFSMKNPIIRILCIYGWLAILIDLDKWSSTVLPSASTWGRTVVSMFSHFCAVETYRFLHVASDPLISERNNPSPDISRYNS